MPRFAEDFFTHHVPHWERLFFDAGPIGRGSSMVW